MIYKISDNQKLIWKFCKTDDNKWVWYCHEQSGYILSQSDKTYPSQLSCVKNAKKNGYSDKLSLPLFLHIYYNHKEGWKWCQSYGCGYIVKESAIFFSTHLACINDAKYDFSEELIRGPCSIRPEEMDE